MLNLSNIHFAYAGNPVLAGIDLHMQAGECVAIVGPNGAGKSTLLRLVAGLIAPSSGTLSVFGHAPSTAKRKHIAQKVAYLSQHYHMAFPFTVLEIVSMGRYTHTPGNRWRGDAKATQHLAQSALARCQVDHLADRTMDTLSGGEQRRVLIAQALCQDSELLLLDEPTAGLDPSHAVALFEIARSECDQGRSCLLVTHDLNLAIRYADRLLVLHQGRSLALAPPSDILEDKTLESAFSIEFHLGQLPNGHGPYLVPVQ